LAGSARTAAIGKVIFYDGTLAKKQLGPFAGGFEFTHSFRPGKDIRMRPFAQGKGPLQNIYCFVLTKYFFE
jgi:hypothetical protein